MLRLNLKRKFPAYSSTLSSLSARVSLRMCFQHLVDSRSDRLHSSGKVDITNETDLANEFYGFLQQFCKFQDVDASRTIKANSQSDTIFTELTGRKLFITGESYAGYYIPYIATRIVDATAAQKAALPLNLQALLINDGVYSSLYV